MSEHKTGHSNWTDEQKRIYWERRKHGRRGQIGYANITETVKDETGNEQRVAVGYAGGPGLSSRMPQLDSAKINHQPHAQPTSPFKQTAAVRSNTRGE